MKNLDKVAPYTSSVAQGDWGTMTTLLAETAISTKDSISFADKTLLANYVYKKKWHVQADIYDCRDGWQY